MATIHHELFIAASAERIYAALTSPEGLSAWWTPGVTTTPQNSTVRFPFGDAYYKEMAVTESIISERLQWRCVAGASEWIGTTLSFELKSGTVTSLKKHFPELDGQFNQTESRTAGTVIIFQHGDWKNTTPMFAECSYTWALFLRSLKLYCETGTGQPWPRQHQRPQEGANT